MSIEEYTKKVEQAVETSVDEAIEAITSDEAFVAWRRYEHSEERDAARADEGDAFRLGFEAGRLFEQRTAGEA